jgi:hypothetical protein
MYLILRVRVLCLHLHPQSLPGVFPFRPQLAPVSDGVADEALSSDTSSSWFDFSCFATMAQGMDVPI